MYSATILFSMIFVLNGLSILNGARLRIDSRSGCTSYTKIHDRKFCDGMRSMGDRDDNGGLFSSAQKCFEYITNPNSKKAKECDGAYFGWNSRDFWTCRCSTSGCSTLVNSGSDTYETDCQKAPTTTTTEAPTTPAAEKSDDCEDKNELCQMEPAFLLDILCQIDTVKQQCPKRCNSCPEPVEITETTEAPTTTKPDPWVPIMQIIEDSTFGFSSSYWTNDALLNENSAVDEKVNAKYASFLSKSFNTIRMCSESHDAKCVSYTFGKTWDNAKQLFNSGFQRASDQDQDEILEVYGPTKGYYADCGMQRPGFNIECRDGNKARWGYCVNCQNQGCQTSDNNDADASIGIGLAGQSTSVEMGAGWTEYFASGPGTCSPNSKAFKRVWVSVMNSEDN